MDPKVVGIVTLFDVHAESAANAKDFSVRFFTIKLIMINKPFFSE